MVEVIGRVHAQVSGLQAGVDIDATGDDDVSVGIHSLHPAGHNEVLPDLPEKSSSQGRGEALEET